VCAARTSLTYRRVSRNSVRGCVSGGGRCATRLRWHNRCNAAPTDEAPTTLKSSGVVYFASASSNTHSTNAVRDSV
jgi:hypothetical protein